MSVLKLSIVFTLLVLKPKNVETYVYRLVYFFLIIVTQNLFSEKTGKSYSGHYLGERFFM